MKKIINKFKERKKEKAKSEIRQYILEENLEAAALVAEKKGFPRTSMILYSKLAKAQDSYNYNSKQEFYNKAAQIAEKNGLKRKALGYFKENNDFTNVKRIVSELKDLGEYVKLYQNIPGFMPYLLEKNNEMLSTYSGDHEKIKREVAIQAAKGLENKNYLGSVVRLFNSLGRKKFANSLIDKFAEDTSKERTNFIDEQNQKLKDLEIAFLNEKRKLEEKYETNKTYLERDEESKLKNFQDDLDDFQNLKDSLGEK